MTTRNLRVRVRSCKCGGYRAFAHCARIVILGYPEGSSPCVGPCRSFGVPQDDISTDNRYLTLHYLFERLCFSRISIAACLTRSEGSLAASFFIAAWMSGSE